MWSFNAFSAGIAAHLKSEQHVCGVGGDQERLLGSRGEAIDAYDVAYVIWQVAYLSALCAHSARRSPLWAANTLTRPPTGTLQLNRRVG